MARKEIVVWTDDMTGETVEEVIREVVCVDGSAYALDLGPESHAAYLALIEPYRAAGTRIGRVATTSGGGIVRSITSGASSVIRSRPTGAAALPDKAQNKAVREWWERHGSAAGLGPVVERGRIPEIVQLAFQRHGGRAPIDVQPAKEPRKATANVKLSSAMAPQATFTEPKAKATAAKAPARGRVTAAPIEAAQRAATPRKRRGA